MLLPTHPAIPSVWRALFKIICILYFTSVCLLGNSFLAIMLVVIETNNSKGETEEKSIRLIAVWLKL